MPEDFFITFCSFLLSGVSLRTDVLKHGQNGTKPMRISNDLTWAAPLFFEVNRQILPVKKIPPPAEAT